MGAWVSHGSRLVVTDLGFEPHLGFKPILGRAQIPLVPINNSSKSFCSQTIPIKFLLFPSITHQNPFVPIKFSNSSNQIPLVPINNPSKSFCSHQTSHQLYFVSINLLFFPTQPYYINPHKALNFVRDWGRRLLGAAKQKVRIFCLPGFVEDRGQICFLQGRRPHFFLHVHLLRV